MRVMKRGQSGLMDFTEAGLVWAELQMLEMLLGMLFEDDEPFSPIVRIETTSGNRPAKGGGS